MPKHIALIQGHPDPSDARFCRALGAAYVKAAREAGHIVHMIDVGTLDFPMLRTKRDFEQGEPPPAIRDAQVSIRRADHLVVIFPLWLSDMPALLKAFFEQAFRPSFAFDESKKRGLPVGLLKGKSAHVFVTMGMPALVYRVFFRAHGLKNLRRNILGFCGVKPVHETLIGNIDGANARAREEWLTQAAYFGRFGA
jgi:putative NADPH-quinone reductase